MSFLKSFFKIEPFRVKNELFQKSSKFKLFCAFACPKSFSEHKNELFFLKKRAITSKEWQFKNKSNFKLFLKKSSWSIAFP